MSNNPKALLIQMWFGKIPDYFRYHFKTTKDLTCFDFLIVTDDLDFKVEAQNYRVIHMTAEQATQRFFEKTSKPIVIPSSKKACDFKISLADLFLEECEGYEYVGFYDIDTMFSRMDQVIDGMNEGYEFITFSDLDHTNRMCGPFTVMRNIAEIREAYKTEQCFADLANPDLTWPDEKTWSDLVFEKFRVKKIYGVTNFDTRSGGKTTYPCFWHNGKLHSTDREIQIYHFYHKNHTKLIELNDEAIVAMYDKTLTGDFYWVTGGSKEYVQLMEGLLRSIHKYSNRPCLVYTFNFDWQLPLDLAVSGQFIIKRLDVTKNLLGADGRDTQLLCKKPEYLLDAVNSMPHARFVYVDADAAITANADSVREYFKDLEYYPLINSHTHDDIVVHSGGTSYNSLAILLSRLGLTRTVYPRRKANFMIFDKRSKWFFEEQLDLYEAHKDSEPGIFALHDEDSANALLSKYNFTKSLPVVDIEEVSVLDLSKYQNYSFSMQAGVAPHVKIPKHENQVLIFHQLKKRQDFWNVDQGYGRSVIAQDEIVSEYKNSAVVWQRNVFHPAAELPAVVDFVVYSAMYEELHRLSNQRFRDYWFFTITDLNLSPGLYPTQIVDSSTGRVLYSDIISVELPDSQAEFKYDLTTPTVLCEIMEKYGSDKGAKNILASWHNYTVVYHSLFNEKRSNSLRVFELGLGTNNVTLPSNMGANGKPGASLYGWREFFPNASIYGADIDKNILFESDRIKTFFCDQTDPSSISEMWSNEDLSEEFDILIEDGLHTFEANVCFFENSNHKVAKGGHFIIEDVANYDLPKFREQVQLWADRYPNFSFTILSIPSTVNNVDNNLIICKNIEA